MNENGVNVLDKFFKSDGAFITILTKIGQIVILNLLWMVCCIPIVTIGASTTAFYYSMIKAVRRERSYPIREFFRSFKRTARNGSILTVIMLLMGSLLYYAILNIPREAGGAGMIAIIILCAIGILFLGTVVYLFPVLSRFEFKIAKYMTMSFYLSLRHIKTTLLLWVGMVASVWLMLVFPMPVIFIIPGVWCYITTYFIEPVLKKYTPKPKEGEEDAWYFES